MYEDAIKALEELLLNTGLAQALDEVDPLGYEHFCLMVDEVREQ